MKYHFIATVIVVSLLSCKSGGPNKEVDTTTDPRMTTDTTMLPGSPGPSGTQPRPSDTTQAHRDSLKHVHYIDSTRKP